MGEAAAEVAFAKDKAADASNLVASEDAAKAAVSVVEKSKEAKPDADTTKVAAAAASSAVEAVAEDLQDEGKAVEAASREAPEAMELEELPLHQGGSLFYKAVSILIVLGIGFGIGQLTYKDATYVSPYKIAAESAYLQSESVMNTREGFVEIA